MLVLDKSHDGHDGLTKLKCQMVAALGKPLKIRSERPDSGKRRRLCVVVANSISFCDGCGDASVRLMTLVLIKVRATRRDLIRIGDLGIRFQLNHERLSVFRVTRSA